MKDTLREARRWMKIFNDKTPEKMSGFRAMIDAIEGKTSPEKEKLSIKQKELIAVALSIVRECKWCIAIHVKNSLEAGATEDEILEAAWMSVMMGGGPALMYFGLVLEALEEFKE